VFTQNTSPKDLKLLWVSRLRGLARHVKEAQESDPMARAIFIAKLTPVQVTAAS
jgi:hypothetical protein